MYVLIVGGGKVGCYLAQMLLSEGLQVMIIEKRDERANVLLKEFSTEIVMCGNGTDPVLLEQIGILKTAVVAAVTGNDETNLVVTNLARLEFGVARTIARVNNPKNAWMFTKEMGVDVALNQADLMAHLIREEMSPGDMMTLLKLQQGQYSLVEEKVHPESTAVGKTIGALKFPDDGVITAVIRDGQLVIPRAGVVLEKGDEVLAVIHADSAKQLGMLFGSTQI
jgi:trk system potassium uptake protein